MTLQRYKLWGIENAMVPDDEGEYVLASEVPDPGDAVPGWLTKIETAERKCCPCNCFICRCIRGGRKVDRV